MLLDLIHMDCADYGQWNRDILIMLQFVGNLRLLIIDIVKETEISPIVMFDKLKL